MNILQNKQNLRSDNMKIYAKNCLMFDKDLDGIDPFDKTLSKEIKLKILQECKNNMFYFLAVTTDYNLSLIPPAIKLSELRSKQYSLPMRIQIS